MSIQRHMGDLPEHRPIVRARLRYDDDFLNVLFEVEDRWVKAVAKGYQDSPCRDSCVELFFTPGPEISEGYFNIEANCGGTILFMHQTARGVDRIPIAEADAAELQVAHSLPAVVDPEIATAVTWRVGYRIPFAMLAKYAPVRKPAPGVTWKANLYKCADDTSHPHWLTWSPVDLPKPDFHRPGFFGTLEFGE